MVRLDEIGDTYPGYVASYQIDHVNYGTAAPWPAEADGTGRDLDPPPHSRLRQRSRQLGGKQQWRHAGIGKHPLSTPRVRLAPTNVRATITGGNQVNLTWTPSVDPESGVDHYMIYRDGQLCGTSTTTNFTDSSNVTAQGRHSYQISAVNHDGFEGLRHGRERDHGQC